MTQALRAHALYKRDVNYLVDDGTVIIVDEFTGRKMPGRRWSDGLHQAIEAKEGVEIQEENQTLATISYQNFFRIYKKLAGMTGTADTEAEEFHKIYKLDVTVVPTNRPMIRADHHDVVYKNEKGKFRAVVAEIEDCHKRGQPVLVGTVSVEKSEVVASLLRKKSIPHNVLNAKQHEREAFVVAQAGKKGAVTISTNMAGRGTDIILGGNPEFLARAEVDPENAAKPGARGRPRSRSRPPSSGTSRPATPRSRRCWRAGGLHILGTERHESRRIDNQLRGRAGRQGDPGSSRFFLSLEDDLMRIFGAERITGWMERLGMEEDVPIEHPLAQQDHRERPEAGRGPQLRHPQEPARIRRRHEPAAQDHLCAAPAGAGGALRARAVGRGEEGRQGARPCRPIGRAHRRVAGQVGAARAGPHGRGADPGRPPRPAPAARRRRRAGHGGACPLDPASCRSGIYRQFGAYLDVDGILEDRTGTLDRLAGEVASSLVQQRERVLDLSDDVLAAVLDEHCPPNQHAEDWDLDALAAALQERFGFAPRAGEGRSSARPWPASCGRRSRRSSRPARRSSPCRSSCTCRGTSSSRRSTRAGSITSSRWRPCARASACAATARRTPSRSTRRKASSSSAR